MKKIKSTRELERILFKISSLTSSERKLLLSELRPKLDAGGINDYELKSVLWKLRKERKISETDLKGIMRELGN